MFKKSKKVTFLNEKWEVIIEDFKVINIPRIYEIIYLDNIDEYFRVVNVIHDISGKHEIFIIMEKYSDEDIFNDKALK